MYLQGPWAFGEIAKTSPDLELGTFPLPVTDDPDDLKVRVNIDLAAWIPEASDHKEAAREFLELPLPAGRHRRVQRRAARLTARRRMPPRSTDPRIVGHEGVLSTRREFYQGASQLDPADDPGCRTTCRPSSLGSDVEPTCATIDADWARLAFRQQ